MTTRNRNRGRDEREIEFVDVAGMDEAEALPGNARYFIRPFRIEPGERFVILCRVSNRSQHRKQNLDDQERWIRAAITKAGGKVVGVVALTGSGQADNDGFDPQQLIRAGILANKLDAVLIAECTDRFVRSNSFHTKTKPDAQASDDELEDFAVLHAVGAPLMTLLDPNAKPWLVRSSQRKRGQWAKGRKGGRPLKRTPGYIKQRREKKIDLVRRLHRSYPEWSIRQLEIHTGIPNTTIRRWINSDKQNSTRK